MDNIQNERMLSSFSIFIFQSRERGSLHIRVDMPFNSVPYSLPESQSTTSLNSLFPLQGPEVHLTQQHEG